MAQYKATASEFEAAGASRSQAKNLADKINSLDASVRSRYSDTAKDFYREHAAKGYGLTINQAHRTDAQQRAIKATGVKAASPRNTWHTIAAAADFSITLNGVLDKGNKWKNPYRELLAPIAKANGLANPIKDDVGHFMPSELPPVRGGAALSQYIKGDAPQADVAGDFGVGSLMSMFPEFAPALSPADADAQQMAEAAPAAGPISQVMGVSGTGAPTPRARPELLNEGPRPTYASMGAPVPTANPLSLAERGVDVMGTGQSPGIPMPRSNPLSLERPNFDMQSPVPRSNPLSIERPNFDMQTPVPRMRDDFAPASPRMTPESRAQLEADLRELATARDTPGIGAIPDRVTATQPSFRSAAPEVAGPAPGSRLMSVDASLMDVPDDPAVDYVANQMGPTPDAAAVQDLRDRLRSMNPLEMAIIEDAKRQSMLDAADVQPVDMSGVAPEQGWSGEGWVQGTPIEGGRNNPMSAGVANTTSPGALAAQLDRIREQNAADALDDQLAYSEAGAMQKELDSLNSLRNTAADPQTGANLRYDVPNQPVADRYQETMGATSDLIGARQAVEAELARYKAEAAQRAVADMASGVSPMNYAEAARQPGQAGSTPGRSFPTTTIRAERPVQSFNDWNNERNNTISTVSSALDRIDRAAGSQAGAGGIVGTGRSPTPRSPAPAFDKPARDVGYFSSNVGALPAADFKSNLDLSEMASGWATTPSMDFQNMAPATYGPTDPTASAAALTTATDPVSPETTMYGMDKKLSVPGLVMGAAGGLPGLFGAAVKQAIFGGTGTWMDQQIANAMYGRGSPGGGPLSSIFGGGGGMGVTNVDRVSSTPPRSRDGSQQGAMQSGTNDYGQDTSSYTDSRGRQHNTTSIGGTSFYSRG